MNLQDQVNALMAAIEKDPLPPHNWMNLAGIFLINKFWPPLLSLFDQRQIMLEDGPKLMFQMLFSDTIAKNEQFQSTLAEFTPENIKTQNEVVLSYAAGCCKINRGKIAEGVELFSKIVSAINADESLEKDIPHIGELNWLVDGFVSQTEIDDLKASASLSAADIGLPDEIDWISSRAGQVLGNIVAVAACDAGYFEKYGESFVTSFDETQSLHLHIVGADKEAVFAFQARLPNYNISFSIEDDSSNIGSPYYAMARFIRAEQIQKKLDRDIFLTDVDISAVIGLKQLLAFSSSSEGDICVFEGETIVPWLRYPAAYMYIRNTAESAKYLSLLRLVCMDRLKNPKWFLDQSAINSVNHYVWANMPELRLKTIGSKDNFILNDIFISKFDLAEKKKIRKNAEY